MYTKDDPRAVTTRGGGKAFEPIAATEYFEFDTLDPTLTSDAGSRTWLVRGQNFVLSFSRQAGGDSLSRSDQPFEYIVILPDEGSEAEITSSHGNGLLVGPGIAIVPPGDSTVTTSGDAQVLRLFDCRTEDLLQQCANAESYAEPQSRVALLEPWPDPVGGPQLRLYPLGDVPKVDGRFGRMIRSSAFLVNFMYPSGARDATKLSPHHHDDFQQLSITLQGTSLHHMRTPWGPDAAQWRDDEHHSTVAPAATIIPPPVIHTAQSVAAPYLNIDVFSPPREDFSVRPGWILNAEDYPMPADAEADESVA